MDNPTIAAVVTSIINLLSLLGLGAYLVKTKHVTLDNVRARLVQAELDINEWKTKVENYYADHRQNIDTLKNTVESFIHQQRLAGGDVAGTAAASPTTPQLSSPKGVGPASQAALKTSDGPASHGQ